MPSHVRTGYSGDLDLAILLILGEEKDQRGTVRKIQRPVMTPSLTKDLPVIRA